MDLREAADLAQYAIDCGMEFRSIEQDDSTKKLTVRIFPVVFNGVGQKVAHFRDDIRQTVFQSREDFEAWLEKLKIYQVSALQKDVYRISREQRIVQAYDKSIHLANSGASMAWCGVTVVAEGITPVSEAGMFPEYPDREVFHYISKRKLCTNCRHTELFRESPPERILFY
jgi:hypothetical protein